MRISLELEHARYGSHSHRFHFKGSITRFLGCKEYWITFWFRDNMEWIDKEGKIHKSKTLYYVSSHPKQVMP